MRQSLTDVIYSADRNASSTVKAKFRRSSAKELGLSEQWFQKAIASQPDIVIDPCRSAGLTDEIWFKWGTEVNIPSIGQIDILLVSSSGRVGIVETKLAHAPENRRKILAQVLDYAVNLPSMTIDSLPDLPEEVEEDDVTQRLSDGDFLLILSADCADDRAIRLSDALLGDHLVNSWDLVLVDVVPYVSLSETMNNILLVGSLRKGVVAEPRHIVRVEVVNQSEPPVVIVKPISGERRVSPRVTLSRSDVSDQLEKELVPDVDAKIKDMIQKLTDPPTLLLEHMTGQKLVLRYNPKGGTFRGTPCKALHLIDIYPSGYMTMPCTGLAKRGLDPKEIESHFERLRNIHPRLAPQLKADGSYTAYKGDNCAPIKEIAKRLPDITNIVADISCWLDASLIKPETIA